MYFAYNHVISVILEQIMRLSINKNAIVFSISKEHIHYRTLEHFIRRNFAKVLRYEGSMTVLHSNKEQTKRDYMLKWIKNIVKNNAIISKLEMYDSFPIKIEHKTNYVPVHYLNISIRLLQNRRLLFIFEDENKKVIKKFLDFFSEANAKVIYQGKAVLIEITTQTSLHKLKQMLSVRTIQNSAVQFVYTKSQMHLFLQSLKEKNDTQKVLMESYNLLGITKNSDMAQIKQNYKQLLKKYHPDRVFAKNQSSVNLYTQKFQQVQSAYDTIQKYRAS